MATKYHKLFDGNWHHIYHNGEPWPKVRRRISAAASRNGLAVESKVKVRGETEILAFRTLNPLTCPQGGTYHAD